MTVVSDRGIIMFGELYAIWGITYARARAHVGTHART